MSDYNITVNIMLFEGGVLIDSLSGKTQGQALADKIEQADDDALASGKTDFDLVLSPKEVGMAINALTKGSSELGKMLGDKLEQALAQLLADNGIQYGPGGGTLGQGPLGGNEQQGSPAEGDADLGGSNADSGVDPSDEDEGEQPQQSQGPDL